jgi:3-phenylpropionate/trans-cinnamate dioxygenase ferredoxin subunit
MTRHVVAPAREIPPGSRRIVTVEGRRIGVFNLDGTFYALLDRCPHQGGRLCLGDAVGLVQSAEPGTYHYSRPGEFLKCPWHGWEFDIRTGQSWCDPRRTRVRTYAVSVEPGPYIAETISVSVEQEFVIVDV